MTKSVRKKFSISGASGFFSTVSGRELRLCFAAFFIGSFAGSLFGMFSSAEGVSAVVSGVLDAVGTKPYVHVLAGCAGLHLLVIFFAASVVGFLLIPVLAAVKGFTLSCASAAIISVYRFRGALISAVVLGLPAVLSLPCFFILAVDGVRLSKQLVCFLGGCPAYFERSSLLRHTFVSVFFVAASAAVELFAVPLLLIGLI